MTDTDPFLQNNFLYWLERKLELGESNLDAIVQMFLLPIVDEEAYYCRCDPQIPAQRNLEDLNLEIEEATPFDESRIVGSKNKRVQKKNVKLPRQVQTIFVVRPLRRYLQEG